jgi:hypothetical protein
MQLIKRTKIAFMFFPHHPDAVRLDTVPFVAHVLGKLAAPGWHIDVFLLRQPDQSSESPRVGKNIHYKYISLLSSRAKINFVELTVRFTRFGTYACVFSVGQIGSYIGAIISGTSRCPHVLLNDEFPSCWGPSIWNALERWGARRADLIIVPSEDRETPLKEELQLDSTTPILTIRNSPEPTFPPVQVDWHKRLNIPYGKKIFLHAGTLADWAQVPELLASVTYWRVDAVILLNSRTRGESARYRRQLSHLDNHERVFWISEPLSETMLHSLISYCTGSFGLYRNSGPNVEFVGTSAGKIMRSIVCGTPVIASSFRSLDFITREGLGVQVFHPSEIPTAIDDLIKNQESYRSQCLRFAVSEKPLREKAWRKIVEYVGSAPNGVDLTSPMRRKEPGPLLSYKMGFLPIAFRPRGDSGASRRQSARRS